MKNYFSVHLISLFIFSSLPTHFAFSQSDKGDKRPESKVNEGIDVEATKNDFDRETNETTIEFDVVGREQGRGEWRDGGRNDSGDRSLNREGGDHGQGNGRGESEKHSDRRDRMEYRDFGGERGFEGGRGGRTNRGVSGTPIDRSSNQPNPDDSIGGGRPSENSTRWSPRENENSKKQIFESHPLFSGGDRSISTPDFTGAIGDADAFRSPLKPEPESRSKPSERSTFGQLRDDLSQGFDFSLPSNPSVPAQPNEDAGRKATNRNIVAGRLPDAFFSDSRFYFDPPIDPKASTAFVFQAPFDAVLNPDAKDAAKTQHELLEQLENLRKGHQKFRQNFPSNAFTEHLRNYVEASEFLTEFAEALLDAGFNPEAQVFLGVAAHMMIVAAPDVFDQGIRFLPIAGDLLEILEASSGYELFTQRKLTNAERAVTWAAVIFGNAKLYRTALQSKNVVLKEAGELAEKSRKIWSRFPSDTPEVVRSLKTTGRLPDRFITKDQAEKLGWSRTKDVSKFAPGKAIGGDIFKDKDGILPSAPGRVWFEADLGYVSGKRTTERLLYSNDGKIFLSGDHYQKDWVEVIDWEDVIK